MGDGDDDLVDRPVWVGCGRAERGEEPVEARGVGELEAVRSFVVVESVRNFSPAGRDQ